eukprot:TRINITY_DN8269_c0_g1_i5.p1 TRINITY_DN8269_c0_g1~~TRINITY_DN8269_c0_g1_i5.p1  ORF type:complete len:199 (+),score=20.62 TRINITY_DN8269_c0_g1_i5:45-599(+)
MWEAAIVSHDFATLNRVELSTTMLRDHQAGAYMEALRVVAQRQTGKCSDPPAWTAFDQRNNCALCCTDFTWGSTSHSIAQQAMDRHNCRHCGELVCPGFAMDDEESPFDLDRSWRTDVYLPYHKGFRFREIGPEEIDGVNVHVGQLCDRNKDCGKPYAHCLHGICEPTERYEKIKGDCPDSVCV